MHIQHIHTTDTNSHTHTHTHTHFSSDFFTILKRLHHSTQLSEGSRTAINERRNGRQYTYLKLCTEVIVLLPQCRKLSAELLHLLLMLGALLLQLVAPHYAGRVHLKVHRSMKMVFIWCKSTYLLSASHNAVL